MQLYNAWPLHSLGLTEPEYNTENTSEQYNAYNHPDFSTQYALERKTHLTTGSRDVINNVTDNLSAGMNKIYQGFLLISNRNQHTL